jgi:predicted glycogen debranching enzyme
MIRFGEKICTNLDAGLRREWLETNGLGGFASATINGCNTRRYHGLLVAATKPPVGRSVLLSKLEERLIIDGRRYKLGTNRYPGVIHPVGFQYLKQFRLDPFPTFTFGVETTEVEKKAFMIQGKNTTVIQYRVKGKAVRIQLEIRPLIAFRDYHSLTHRMRGSTPESSSSPERSVFRHIPVFQRFISRTMPTRSRAPGTGIV